MQRSTKTLTTIRIWALIRQFKPKSFFFFFFSQFVPTLPLCFIVDNTTQPLVLYTVYKETKICWRYCKYLKEDSESRETGRDCIITYPTTTRWLKIWFLKPICSRTACMHLGFRMIPSLQAAVHQENHKRIQINIDNLLKIFSISCLGIII